MAKTPFKLRSGNTTPFKKMGSSPMKQAIGGGPGEALKHHKQYLAKKEMDVFMKGLKKSPSIFSEGPKLKTWGKDYKPYKAVVKKSLGKRILGGLSKVVSKVALPLTIADLGYSFYKRGKKTGFKPPDIKKALAPRKGKYTSGELNKPFTFNKPK